MKLSLPGFTNRITTFTALRHRNYRIYWTGLLVAIIGWQILTFTQLWLVYDLTKSTVYLGAVGGINGIANICLSVFGGVLADRVDRRKLIVVTQSLMAILAFILATLALTHLINVWHLLIAAALTGAISAFDNPARQSLVPHLIDDPKDLPNAVALASSVWSAGRIVGPAIAGVLITLAGPVIGFYITALGYGVMVASLKQLSLGKAIRPQTRSGVLSEFKEGINYVLSNSIFLVLIGMTFFNSVFGLSFVYLLPVFAKDILGVGASGYGFLMTATGIGAICGVLTVASLGKTKHRGKLLLAGNMLLGILLVMFSLSRWYPLSLFLIGLADFFSSLYLTTVLTLLQTLVPERLRGRVMGIHGLTWSLMPLGGMQIGVVANFVGAPMAVAIGGFVILGFAVFVATATSRIRNLA